jgi:uncharacterized protein YpmB
MRIIARKRPPFMTLQKWLFLIVACLLLLITFFFIYFREIQGPEWSAIKEAKEQATKAADLASINDVYHHIWSKESWVVEGVNQADEKVFVWLTEDNLPKIIKAEDAVSEQTLKNSFKNEKPDANIKRIQPGLLGGKPIWEVYYDDGQKPLHSLYDFYSFDNGTFIDSYKLPAKTEP